MGSSESSRRVTVERNAEDDSAGIVRVVLNGCNGQLFQVSERVVRRLQGKKDLPLNSKDDLTPEEINKLWMELQHEKAHLETQKYKLEGLLQQAYDEGRGAVVSSEYNESVNMADLERLRDDFKLRENQLVSDIESLKQKNANIDVLSEDTFNAAISEIQEKFRQNERPAVCPDLQEQVINCYQQNPQQTLRCSQFVKEFEICVQKARLVRYFIFIYSITEKVKCHALVSL
ncbi:hypothetical protein QZH41_016196 [Actinostola sp. cb2023]|nr:hypothetical protein QZH41_016196 [Actinostola sp. cb2023]